MTGEAAPVILLRHQTAYHYDRPVLLGPQDIRLHPAPFGKTPIDRYALVVTPEPAARTLWADAEGNGLTRVRFDAPTARFEITVELEATLVEDNPFDFLLEPGAATWPVRYETDTAAALAACLQAEPVRPWLAALLPTLGVQEEPPLDLLIRLNRLVRDRIEYRTRMEPGVQSPERTLDCGSGSCRDMAWLLVQIARSLGLAARFVSGYLIQLADGDAPDRADLHAWAEVYLPGGGWIGLDATSGLVTGSAHIKLAASAHWAATAPVSGTLGADAVAEFSVETTVRRR